MKQRLSVFLAALLAAACAHRTPVTLDLTGTTEEDWRKHVGEIVTLHGQFSLYGKIAPFIQVGGHPIYLVSKGTFSWGEPYASMQGKDVRVTGTLRFAHYPEPPPGELPAARASDHFYFEAETAKIELRDR